MVKFGKHVLAASSVLSKNLYLVNYGKLKALVGQGRPLDATAFIAGTLWKECSGAVGQCGAMCGIGVGGGHRLCRSTHGHTHPHQCGNIAVIYPTHGHTHPSSLLIINL